MRTATNILFAIVLLALLILGKVTAQTATHGTPYSLYTDVKAHTVGDVVTVLVVENARASRNSELRSNSEAQVNADGKIGGTFSNFLPLFGAATTVGNSVDDAEGTKQEDQLSAKITATIVEETEGGLYRIHGERSVTVNGEENLMRLEGLVRGRDILADNTVYSYNIADASIEYRKNGLDDKLGKPAALTRFLTWGLSTGLILAAFLGSGV